MTALGATTFEWVAKPMVVKEAVLPEYYVLLCAGRYAATVKKLALAATDDERQQHRKSLEYLLESGMIEADRERALRLRRYVAQEQFNYR